MGMGIGIKLVYGCNHITALLIKKNIKNTFYNI